MPVYKNASAAHFTTIPNIIIRDKTLSVPARMLLILMLSFPKDWEFSMEWLRANHFSAGRQVTQNAVAELLKRGYLKRDLRQDKTGKMNGYIYSVYDAPQPAGGKPAAGFSAAGNQTTTKD